MCWTLCHHSLWEWRRVKFQTAKRVSNYHTTSTSTGPLQAFRKTLDDIFMMSQQSVRICVLTVLYKWFIEIYFSIIEVSTLIYFISIGFLIYVWTFLIEIDSHFKIVMPRRATYSKLLSHEESNAAYYADARFTLLCHPNFAKILKVIL